MKRDLHKTLSTLIVVLCLATATSCILPNSNLITNPSFENGITGWSVGGSGHVNIVIEGNASDGSFAANFSRGDTTVGSTLSQTITTQVGKTYELSFDARSYAYNNDPSTLQVEIIGSATLLSQTYTLINSVSGPFTTYGVRFTADSPTTTIRFTDGGSTFSNDAVLDNVRVVAK